MKKTILAVLWVVFGVGFVVGQPPIDPVSQPTTSPANKPESAVESPKPVIEPPAGASTQTQPTSSAVKGSNGQSTKKKNEKSPDAEKGKTAEKTPVDTPITQVALPLPVANTAIENLKNLLTKPDDAEALANFIRDGKEEPDNLHLTAAKKLEKAWRTEKDNAANSNSHFWIALIIGFLATVGVIIGWAVSQNALKKKQGKTIASITESMKSNPPTGLAGYSTSNLESEIIDLKLQLGQAKTTIEEFKKSNPTTGDETTPGSKIITSPREAASAKINRYFNSPNPTDQSFNDQNGTTAIQPFASTYEITLDRADSETATFRLLSNQETLRKILNTPETYIEPMCQADNAFNPFAKNIKTLEGGDGVVKKRDGIWYLETKARIHYE